jgi:hypothetical protein
VNILDSQLQSAADADERDAFASALQALGDAPAYPVGGLLFRAGSPASLRGTGLRRGMR